MELKEMLILLTIFLTGFIVFAMPYVDVTNNYNIDGSNDMSMANQSKYDAQLDNVRSGAYDDFQNATRIGSVGLVIDTLGALVESGFGVATQTVETAEDSTELINDVQRDTKDYIPQAIFVGFVAIVFIGLLFGLIKLLTGR